jgi:hypothetical protein
LGIVHIGIILLNIKNITNEFKNMDTSIGYESLRNTTTACDSTDGRICKVIDRIINKIDFNLSKKNIRNLRDILWEELTIINNEHINRVINLSKNN